MRALAAGVAASLTTLLLCTTALAEEHPTDVCLEVAPGVVTAEEWVAVAEVVERTAAGRPALFPTPSLDRGTSRLDLGSGHLEPGDGGAGCLVSDHEWTARFGRAFLEAGADRMLADAPTTPGIDSDVFIEWFPDDTRVRTTLVFAGPLDIPNGTCWIDDALTIDETSGVVVASGEQGLSTSPFAEGACGRFFDHLPDGGAGEQAVTLLPPTVVLGNGGELRFVAEDVRLEADSISVSGSVTRDRG